MAVLLWRVGVCEKFIIRCALRRDDEQRAAASARSDEQMNLACG